jgi:hypothetical protein
MTIAPLRLDAAPAGLRIVSAEGMPSRWRPDVPR